MGELFKPDIFSVSHPIFSSVTTTTAQVVRTVAQDFYSDKMLSLGAIEQFGGNEINSNNFKLYTPQGIYLLKRLPLSADKNLLERQLSLLSWLRAQGTAVPSGVLSGSGATLVKNADAYWCLFDFLPGDFFHGTGDELISAGVGIGQLQAALNQVPSSLAPPKKWETIVDSDVDIVSLAEARKHEWMKLLGEDNGSLLSNNWERVKSAFQELQENKTLVRSSPLHACHCDLHPHNLLVNEGRLAGIIDFESFVSMPVTASIGYAAYKLVRQHVVENGFSEKDSSQVFDATARFFHAVQKGGGFPDIDFESLRLMALAELFRRLLIVLRLNFVDGNSVWNRVLPMHLAGLDEIDVIFGRHAKV